MWDDVVEKTASRVHNFHFGPFPNIPKEHKALETEIKDVQKFYQCMKIANTFLT